MKLPRPQRTFLPESCPLDQAPMVEEWFRTLEKTPVETEGQFRSWLAQWAELESALRQEGAVRYVRMTCDTSDEANAHAYSRFIEDIEPLASVWADKLRRKLVKSPFSQAPDLAAWLRQVAVDIDLFREENVPLETRVSLEIQEYQKITGAMSVLWEGEEKTLSAMTPFLLAPDRAIREKAWRAVAERRLRDRENLDTAFDKLFSLRLQVAHNSGHPDFLPFIFKAKGRFDYTPEDCQQFHRTVAECVVPRARALQQRRAQRMGLSALRPWDLECDPQGRGPLRPFADGATMLATVEALFERLHPKMGQWFGEMRQRDLLDVDSRKGKAPGGYQISFDESRVPFIFMNSSGTNGDLYTLLHEAGHAFHQFAMADQSLPAYRDCPSEFAEVASMSMELIGSSDLTGIYTPEQAARSRREELEDVLRLLPWVAQIDAFQHTLYRQPNHSAADRRRLWLDLQRVYAPQADWTGLEEFREVFWQRQLHLFEVPFYYIEYGIAQLGALQLWANFRRDPQATLSALLKALALGSSRPLPELFATAGIHFGFDREHIEPLMDLVEGEILRLEALEYPA